ncbi:MAG: 3-dehydroquinate synthase [Oscillospiraceae bacterium]|nr:3-dehydroquinate synthase [Oscillospiraceae bacterium]
MKTITVSVSKTYDIFVGSGLLGKSGGIISQVCPGLSAAIVTDSTVDSLYGGRLADILAKSGLRVSKYVFPQGEESKNPEIFLSILNFLAQEKITRADAVVALGGGVAGDLAGFAAASYMRGAGFIQIPTTLLAAVDSSVGGKTGINLPSGKNLAGAFYQPDAVICDTSLLSTLDPEVFKDGCAEVIKYGMIADRTLLKGVEMPGRGSLEDVIARCVSIKRDIVAGDELERGERRMLNFGHTVGHAVELLSGYQISHGRAVAIGMATITRATVKMGLCRSDCLDDLLESLDRHSLPQSTSYNACQLARACLSDKKRGRDGLVMVFPVEPGKCELKKIPVSDLEQVIRLGLEG